MEENTEVKFLEMLVKNIVEKEEDVKVEHGTDERGIKLTVHVNDSDMGKIIGTGGKMAIAIRSLMHAYGGKHDKRIGVVIHEPNDARGGEGHHDRR